MSLDPKARPTGRQESEDPTPEANRFGDAGRHSPPHRLGLSVEEACGLLGISRSLGYELAAQGGLPTIRPGRRIVVPRAALERLLDGGPDPAA
jgi:excisionase family DNA binding protein